MDNERTAAVSYTHLDVYKRQAYQSAKDNPAEENLFRQLRLNQWVKQSVRWMPMDAWDKCDTLVNPETLDVYKRQALRNSVMWSRSSGINRPATWSAATSG